MTHKYYGRYGPGRNADNAPFSKRDVEITLTGAQWVTILARLIPVKLSPAGERLSKRAQRLLQEQLLEQQRISQ